MIPDRAAARPDLPPSLGSSPSPAIEAALAGDGLWLDVGAAVLRVQGESPALGAQLQAVYPHLPLASAGSWADVHCRLDPPRGLRRWLRPQVLFSSDAKQIFSPFPADAPLPLFEWGCNWLLGQRLHHLLLLHAGAVERHGHALVLPALPGSGKSTLTAALAERGWRLLSDEFGTFDPQRGEFRALLKPVALKNESIAVIREFSPAARIGPAFPKTRKGTVAHLAASADAVARRQIGARPGLVVLPRWEAGSATRWQPLPAHAVFAALAFNAFNYQLIGEAGYDAVVGLAQRCPGFELVYSRLDEALALLERCFDEQVASLGTAPPRAAT